MKLNEAAKRILTEAPVGSPSPISVTVPLTFNSGIPQTSPGAIYLIRWHTNLDQNPIFDYAFGKVQDGEWVIVAHPVTQDRDTRFHKSFYEDPAKAITWTMLPRK